MGRISLCGGSYQSASPNADCEYTQNWVPEPIESGVGAGAIAMYNSPGLGVFCNLTGMNTVLTGLDFRGASPILGAVVTERAFVVAQNLQSQYLWEIFTTGAPINRGPLGAAQLGAGPTTVPASMAINNAKQLMIASSGRLFYFNLTTNLLAEIDTTSGNVMIGPVAQIGFSDGFFVALIANSQTLQVSAALNGTASGWSPLNFTIVSVFPDQVLAMLIDHREVWLWGAKQTIPYFDAGAPIFPYLPVPGGFIEQGIAAAQSPVKLDNSVFWIGADDRGAGIAWRANGYLPSRVSNYGIEREWQSFPTIADAIGYSFQDQGHSFVHWLFPTGQKAYRYDVSTGMWHHAMYNQAGLPVAHLSRFHFFAFGKHLVGDRQSGNIYEMNIKYLTDNGVPIQRIRRGPPVVAELDFMFLEKFRINLETGLGPEPPLTDAAGNPRDPQMYFRDSRDGGHNWSDPVTINCGKLGDFLKLAEVRRLGRARQWVPEISVTDPISWRIIDAYLDGTGFEKTQRLAKRFAQQA